MMQTPRLTIHGLRTRAVNIPMPRQAQTTSGMDLRIITSTLPSMIERSSSTNAMRMDHG